MSLVRTTSAIALIGTIGLAGTACSSAADSSSSSSTTQRTTITVGAASSLTDVLSTIAADFTKANPGVSVQFSFAASSAVAEQIRGGAPLDVFASAGTTSMQPLIDEGLVAGAVDVATNSLQIAVPPGNPAAVTGLADLAGVKVVICQEQVPCGVATAKLFDHNSLTVTPVSYEPDVRSVLGKIEADEADAGIDYVTDVLSAGAEFVGVVIPPEANVTTTYQAGVVAASTNAAEAAMFVDFLADPEAQAALAGAGFAPAP
ncbi:MAG: molybdate ABC transporter substrate-binding protein [Actinomycetota bacterium]